MTTTANIAFFKTRFIAQLEDGAALEHSDFRELARLLAQHDVTADTVTFNWCPGQRMITAGQQVALCAELRQLADHPPVKPARPANAA